MTDQNDMKMDKLETSMIELTKSINSLVLEMRERDIEDRYLREKVIRMERVQEVTIREWAPIWARSKKSQENRDSFFASARSTSGKIFMVAVIVSILLAAGINPKSLGL